MPINPGDTELDRVLENPDNLIVSSGLEEIIDFSEGFDEINSSEDTQEISKHILKLGEKEYSIGIKKMEKFYSAHWNDYLYKFVLFVPTLTLEELVDESYLTLHINDFMFLCNQEKIKWKGDFLTITTRRKFDETV